METFNKFINVTIINCALVVLHSSKTTKVNLNKSVTVEGLTVKNSEISFDKKNRNCKTDDVKSQKFIS